MESNITSETKINPISGSVAGKLEPTFQQLEEMNLETSPFVVISVIGQELLAAGLYSSAVVVLESALQIGTCSLKLRGSVFSALSSAYWALNSLEKVSHTPKLTVSHKPGDDFIQRLNYVHPLLTLNTVLPPFPSLEPRQQTSNTRLSINRLSFRKSDVY